jgi:hypothetical protein
VLPWVLVGIIALDLAVVVVLAACAAVRRSRGRKARSRQAVFHARAYKHLTVVRRIQVPNAPDRRFHGPRRLLPAVAVAVGVLIVGAAVAGTESGAPFAPTEEASGGASSPPPSHGARVPTSDRPSGPTGSRIVAAGQGALEIPGLIERRRGIPPASSAGSPGMPPSGQQVPPPGPLPAPASFTVRATAATEIDLTWSPVAQALGYRIDRAIDPSGAWAQIASTSPAQTTYADVALDYGSTYYYRVTVEGLTSHSAPSDVSSAMTAPVAPSAVVVSPVSSTEIDLTWGDVSGESGYRIEGSNDGIAWATVGTTAQDVTSYADAGLLAGTTRYYRVVAVNAAGSSPASQAASATTPTSGPASPSLVPSTPSP